MKKYKWFLISMFAVLLLACGGGGADSPVDHEPVADADTLDLSNVLSLGYQKALAKQAYVCPDTAAGVDIDIGCILRSGNNYFVLDNTTEYELTDVAIVSSNPAFVATPAKIGNIGVVGKSTGITPMLRVAISHGTELNDMSVPDPLDEGTAKTTLTITGKVNGQEFSQEYVIGGYAKTIRAISRNGEVFIEGPMYNNTQTLVNSFKMSTSVSDCNKDSTLICYSPLMYYEKFPVHIMMFMDTERIAPLSKQFIQKNNIISLVDSLIIKE